MPHKYFTVTRMTRGPKLITLVIKPINGKSYTHTIQRDDFEDWLERTGRLEYELDVVPDENGEPDFQMGDMDLTEYWKLDNAVHTDHLEDYIIYCQPNEFFNLKKSFEKIAI